MNKQPFTGYRAHAVLADFLLNRRTGILHFFPHHRKIFLENGQLVFTESDFPEEHFSKILVKQGVLSQFQLEEVQRELQPNSSIGKALREQGLATPKQLAVALKKQITDILIRVLNLKEGEIAIETCSLSEGLPRLNIQTLPLLVKLLTQTGTVQTVKFRPEERAMEPAPGFSNQIPSDLPRPYDRFIRFANGKDRFSFKDLNDALGLSRQEVHAFLYLLDLTNVVKIHPSQQAGLDLKKLLKEANSPQKPLNPMVLGGSLVEREKLEPEVLENEPTPTEEDLKPTFDLLETPMPDSDELSTLTDMEMPNEEEPEDFPSLSDSGFDTSPTVESEAERAAQAFRADLEDLNVSKSDSEDVPTESAVPLEDPPDMEALSHFDLPGDEAALPAEENEPTTPSKLKRGVILPDRDSFDNHPAVMERSSSSSRKFLVLVSLATIIILSVLYISWKTGLLDPAGSSNSHAANVSQNTEPEPRFPADTGTDAGTETLALGDGVTEETTETEIPDTIALGDAGSPTSENAIAEMKTQTRDIPEEPAMVEASDSDFNLVAAYRANKGRLNTDTLNAMIADSEMALLEREGNFTIAFMVACNPDTLRQFLADQSLGPIYLLPRTINGKRCYLLSWNHYAERVDAQRSLKTAPASIQSQKPWVLEIP